MQLKGKKVIALVEHDAHDIEHWYPVYRLREEGAQVDLVGLEANVTYKGKFGAPAKADFSFKDIHSKDYDGILVPGGWAPDKLRRYPELLKIIQEMDADKKTIGQICHAGWVLISAGILQGKTVTSTPAIKDDMTNAGATWVNEEVVVDGHIISSRSPDDLPVYMKAYINHLAQ